jgi:hypothetical protein
MVVLDWFEAFPPPELDLADVTALLRPLATRGRAGLFKPLPVVVFELIIEPGRVRWLVGVERRLARSLPGQLRAQLPRLMLVERPSPERPRLGLAQTIRASGLSFPLRVDTAQGVAAALLAMSAELSSSEHLVVQWVIGPSAARHRPPAEFRWREALGIRPPAKPDSAMQRAWQAKVAEPLFGVQGRVGVTTRQTDRAIGLMKSAVAALSLANSPQTRLIAGRGSTVTARRLMDVMGSGRTWTGIVNAAELAVLLGWPLGTLVPGRSGPLLDPAPEGLLVPEGAQPADDSRVVGVSLHPADGGQGVTMPAASSTHHLHVIGPTGSGKSHELTQLILADAGAGYGLLTIDPKGDLVHDVLSRLPKQRHPDVVLIEPAETGSVIGLNPLGGATAAAERRADDLLHLFRELFGTALGPRSSDVLLHALITAARLPDGTLTDVPVLLTNPAFRRRSLALVSDPLVLVPYWGWYDALSEGERGQVIAPIMNKLRVLLSRAALRRMLGQAKPRFTLDKLFTHRLIVLVNLNKGLIGPETAKLLGSLLLSQLWLAIQRQAAVPSDRRRPVMCFIDEWQDYTGALDFGDVLAQSRGLGVGFTLAHQHLGQLSPGLQSAVLANARSRFAFRPAHKDAHTLAAVLGGGVAPGDLERLDAFQACCRLFVAARPSDPFAVRTLPLPAPTNNVTELRRASRDRFGVDGEAIDMRLIERWQGGISEADGPIGITRRRPS